jgi:hypothetical protein
MSDVPSAQATTPEGPPPEPSDGSRASSTPAKRTRWLRSLTPLILAGLGAALLIAGWLLYPSVSQSPAPAYSELVLTSAVPVNYISYEVYQSHPNTAVMRISVVLPPHQSAGAATLEVEPPIGTMFVDCPPPACHILREGGETSSSWIEHLVFTRIGSAPLNASAHFRVKASSFGVAANGVTATASIPDVTYSSPAGRTEAALIAGYNIPSASSYDWSAFPTFRVDHFAAYWQEPMPQGETSARAAVGINHAAQSDLDTRSLLAGTLIGIAGGAIIAAVQEALHARSNVNKAT